MSRAATRAPRAGATALVVGSVVSGLLAYVLFAATTRALGAEAAAPVSVLWSWWGFAGAAVTFPVQHWVTHEVTARGEGAVGRSLLRVGAGVLVVAALAGLAAGLGREQLFHRSDPWFPVMVGLVTVGSAWIGLVRGVLTAWGRYAAVAASLVAENGLRCLLVVVLLAADESSPVVFGACLVAGHAVVLLWPRTLAVGWRRRREASGGSASPFRFLAGAGSAQLVAQVVLSGGPVLLAVSSAPQAQVTALFAALALFRAPYQLGIGVVGAWNARVTRLVAARDVGALRRVRRLTAGAAVGLCLLAAAFAAVAGPAVLRLVFGEEVRMAAGQTAVVAVGCTVALVNLVATVTVLAQGRPGAVTLAWSAALVAAIATGLLVQGPLDRVLWLFVVAEVTALAGLLAVRPRPLVG